MITITLHTDNAAFDEEPEFVVADVLRRIATTLESIGIEGNLSFSVQDDNGNTIGKVESK